MPVFRLLGLLLLLLGGPTPASAQMPATPVRPTSSVMFVPRARGPLHSTWSSVSRDSVRTGISPTYWKEGAIVGGVAGAVSLGLFGSLVCGLSEESGQDCVGTTLLGGLLGAGLGAIPGALVGGLFPKGPKREGDPAPGS